jgi:hypothetical protein
MAQGRPYDWQTPESFGFKQTYKTTLKYALDADGLTLGKTRYRPSQELKGPEDIVFFYNENNVVENDTANPYAFSIEKIDDVNLDYLSTIMFGTGYQNLVEEREVGVHTINFRQSQSEAEGRNEIYGHFTKNFLPGLYRFSVFTDKHTAFMPRDLPPVPPNHARVVIIRQEFGKSETLYDYIDASLW